MKHDNRAARWSRRASLTLAASALALALAAPASAQSTLDFPSWQAEEPGVSSWWKAVVADFEAQNAGVKVNLYSIPFANYVQQLTVRFAGNNPPDIVHLPTRNFAAFASQGWLQPIDDRLAKTDILKTWTPLQGDMKWDGKMQGVLLMGYGSLLYYNQKLLDEAGAKLPTTPDEWLGAIEKSTKRDAGQFGLVATSIEHPNLVVEAGTWVMGQGLDWVKDGKYQFTDPKVLAAVEQYRKSMRFAPPGTNSTTARQLFIDGKATFLRDGPWIWAFVEKAPEATKPFLKVTRVPFPSVTGGTSNSIHIASGTPKDKQELAWKFIELAASPKWQAQYPIMSASPAPRKDSLPPDAAQKLPHLKLIMDSAATAVSVFPTQPALMESYNEYASIFGRSMLKLQSTQDPTEKIMGDLQKELERAVPLK
jgi:multiple sugar transport system substrate-binding protein